MKSDPSDPLPNQSIRPDPSVGRLASLRHLMSPPRLRIAPVTQPAGSRPQQPQLQLGSCRRPAGHLAERQPAILGPPLRRPHTGNTCAGGRLCDGGEETASAATGGGGELCAGCAPIMVPSFQRLIEAIFELQRRKKEAKMEDDQSSEGSVEDAPPANHYGCKHYRRKARLVAPCCGKVYACRFCHDEVENHELDRKTVSEVVCIACGNRQGILQSCTSCDIVLAEYFCAICRLYDDDDKKQYHCEGCGICRVGGRDAFYHCDICDMCLPNNLKDNHKCVEKASRTNCAVCMEDIHTSRISSHIPPCGHMIHKPCFRMLVDRGYYACPTCNVAMFKMDSVWSKLDQEVAETQMPARYRNCYAKIICNDCQARSVAAFHVIGLKCASCGSYNTARGDGPLYKRNAKEELVPFSELDDDDDEPEPAVQPPPAAGGEEPAVEEGEQH